MRAVAVLPVPAPLGDVALDDLRRDLIDRHRAHRSGQVPCLLPVARHGRVRRRRVHDVDEVRQGVVESLARVRD